MSDATRIAQAVKATIPGENPQLLALRRVLAELMAVDPLSIPEDISLIELGLDSLAMMRIPTLLKKQGFSVVFKDLARQPTLGAWADLLVIAPAEYSSGLVQTIPQRATKDRFPLTPLQQAYLLGRDTNEALGGVACQLYSEFDGQQVESARLETAVFQLCERHPMLRARFHPDGFQEIMDAAAWRGLTVHNLSDDDEAIMETRLTTLRNQLSHRLLDIFNGQVFDVQLSSLPHGRSRIHVNVDLLVADVLSITIIFRDLAALYNGRQLAARSSAITFPDYLAARESQLRGEVEIAAGYWKARLDQLPSGPSLPLVRDPAHSMSPRFSRRAFRLSSAELDCLADRARASGVTLAVALTTAFAEILARWSGDDRFLLNIPVFDRQELDPAVADMVADFTNLVLLEVDLTGAQAFASRARSLQARLHQDLAHSAFSGIEVVRELIRSGRPRGRIAPVVFTPNIADRLVNDEFEASLGTLGWSLSQTPQVWLDHQVYRLGDRLLLNWDAIDASFPDGMLDDMFDAYRHHIQRLCNENWEQTFGISIPRGQAAVRDRVNATGAPVDTRLLHEPFLARAEISPHDPAVMWTGGQLSYGDLLARAQRLAARLEEQGIAPGDHVAVVLAKGPEQIIAVLGILLAGAVYVPIVVDSPPERLSRIIDDAQCRAIVAQSPTESTARPNALPWIDPDIDDPAAPAMRVYPARLPDDLAYIIYTSGSTGAPKGVMIDHRGALNTLLDVNRRWSVTARDRIFALSSLTFDLSVYDVFGTLAAGACIVLPDEEGRRDPGHWTAVLASCGVTIWNSVPALMEMLVEFAERAVSPRFAPTLRLALLSGDWIPVSLPDRVRALFPAVKLIGLGGATEASIWSNWFEIEHVPKEWSSIPYGYPLTNQRYHVLNGTGEHVPDWVPGDLFIAGIGLAQGYWNDPGKTQASFFHSRTGERLYKTGDHARYWPDGTLEFLGRRDSQVKIRGHRIELGEVEAALVRVPAVRQAAADLQIIDGQSQIVGYLSLDRDPSPPSRAIPSQDDAVEAFAQRVILAYAPDHISLPDINILKAELSRSLPDYMLPRHFVLLNELPLSSNGKVDRSRLPRLARAATTSRSGIVPPAAGLEADLAAIWRNVLKLDSVYADDHFFDLGGDSLRAARVIGEINRKLGARVSIRRLFEKSHLRDFAEAVRASRDEPASRSGGCRETALERNSSGG